MHLSAGACDPSGDGVTSVVSSFRWALGLNLSCLRLLTTEASFQPWIFGNLKVTFLPSYSKVVPSISLRCR